MLISRAAEMRLEFADSWHLVHAESTDNFYSIYCANAWDMVSVLMLLFQTSISPLFIFLASQYEPQITALQENVTVKEKAYNLCKFQITECNWLSVL